MSSRPGVIEPFVAAYLDGRTPSPCIDCNTYVKFGALLGRARHLYECEAVATGHYARRIVVDTPGGPRARLARAADADKDQTYFLYGLRQDQLWHSRFPLGDLTKPEVRAIARSLDLVTADKPESQEICFVPGGDYREELRTRGGWTPETGPILDADGERVGEHGGAAGFTVGQRKGIGVALGEPRYVSRIDPATNAIVLGRREDLEMTADRARGRDVRRRRAARRRATRTVAGRRSGRRSGSATARRSSTPPCGRRARTSLRAAGRWIVETDTPVWAIAPGQACVLYDGDTCLGGGRIAIPARRRRPTPLAPRPRRGARSRMTIPPALPLALLLGLLHTSIYVLIRGDAGGRLPLTYVAASLGAWAGAALGNRLGLDLIAIGDFPLIPASIMAWVGIGIVAILATLGPQRAKA